MKLCTIGDYEVHVPTSGGKAGKGNNVTTGIQIRKDNVILKTIRVKRDAPMPTVMQKVNDWIAAQDDPQKFNKWDRYDGVGSARSNDYCG